MASQTRLTAPGAQAPRSTVAQSPERRSRQRRRNLWIYAFLMPTFVLYGLYTIYPIIASYWYSLVEWNGFSSQMRFVGISNYEAVLADPMFWASVRITLVSMLVVAPLRIFGAFFLAILLNSPKLPFATFFRTAYFIPVVTTTAIVGVVMRFIFDPGAGPVAAVLGVFDLPPVDLLGDSTTTLFTAAIVYVWKFFGITMIYWLAALQTIPRDLFEAARIDGAGGFRIFRNITLPMLLPGTNSFQIPDARGRWAAGNVGFFIDGPWSPGGVRALNEAHLPKMAQAGELTPEGEELIITRGAPAGTWFMAGNSGNPEAATLVLESFTQDDYQAALAEAMDQPPLNLDTVAEADVIEPYATLIADFKKRVFRAPQAQVRKVEVSKALALATPIAPHLGDLIQGYLGGNITDLKGELVKLSDNFSRDLDSAIEKANAEGADVSRLLLPSAARSSCPVAHTRP